MALVLKDRVKETTTTTGTGTLTLAGASTGYQSFSAIGDGNTCYYAISSSAGSEWEVGLGTYTSAGTTLARTTILASSNSGSVVTLSAGTKDVYVVYPAGRSVWQDSLLTAYSPQYAASNGLLMNNLTIAFGTIVEILQLYEIEFLGRTFDPWDFLMYVIGVGLGIVIDLTIIDKFEKQGQKNDNYDTEHRV